MASPDAAADRPTVARAVTLEVDTVSAQKLSLAGSLGALSLALRKAGEQVVEQTRQVTPGDFASAEQRAAEPARRFATVTVNRGGKAQEYSVVPEEAIGGEGAREVAGAPKSNTQRVIQAWGRR